MIYSIFVGSAEEETAIATHEATVKAVVGNMIRIKCEGLTPEHIQDYPLFLNEARTMISKGKSRKITGFGVVIPGVYHIVAEGFVNPGRTHSPAGIKIMTPAQRTYLKGTTYDRKNSLWGKSGIGSTRSAGAVMELISDTHPSTIEEWTNIYTSDPRGRTWKQLDDMGAKWAKMANLSREEALAWVLIHIIDETFEGYKNEEEIRQIINRANLGFFVKRASGDLDRKYAIDLTMHLHSGSPEIIGGIQIKPNSYFSRGDKKHRLAVLDKHDLAMKDLGITVRTVNIKKVKEGEIVLYTPDEVRQMINSGVGELINR